MHSFLRLILLAASLTACVAPPTTDSDAKSEITNCAEERPDMCTMDYRPVCATRDTGVRCVTTPCPSTEQKTYSNACSSCADVKVIGYISDQCPTSPGKH
jgi:hypothetical protein